MKRLCGLLLFSLGAGMTWALVVPKSFRMVVLAIAFMIIGYNLFCCK